MAEMSDKTAGKIPPKTLDTGTVRKPHHHAYSNGNKHEGGDNSGGANAGKPANQETSEPKSRPKT